MGRLVLIVLVLFSITAIYAEANAATADSRCPSGYHSLVVDQAGG